MNRYLLTIGLLCVVALGLSAQQGNQSLPGGSGSFSGGLGASFQDATEIAAPANPAAGNDRLFLNSSGHVLSCLTSSGANCMPAGGTVTTTGSPASGNLTKFSGTTSITNGDLSGDCTTSGALAITCTKTSGSAFATSATTDATNATNISSGTLACGRLPSLTGDVTSSAGSCTTTAGGNTVTASAAASAAKQICVSSAASKSCSYIDFPDSKSVPFAICVNGTAATGITTTTAVGGTCRAGTNNKDAFVGPFTTSDSATFKIHLPKDWDTATAPSLSVDLASTDATNGHTVILQAATECSKLDGSTTDDVAFNTAQSMGTITLGAGGANQSWTTTLASLTTTGCTAPGIMWVKLTRTTDTATNVELYEAEITIPRLLTVQAN